MFSCQGRLAASWCLSLLTLPFAWASSTYNQENYCGEFKENLGTGVFCEEDEDEDNGWNCDFDFKIPKDL